MRNIWNAQIHSMGRMRSLDVLNEVVLIVTTGVYRIKNPQNGRQQFYSLLLL
jgi:hypothetical protein